VVHLLNIVDKLKSEIKRILPGGCNDDRGRVGEEAENFQ